MCNRLTALERCRFQRCEQKAEENEVEHCTLLRICAQQTEKNVTVVSIENTFEIQWSSFKALLDIELMSTQSSLS